MLREALRGRRIAITGATGFLGTALVERLLRTIPDSEVALLVRPGRRGAADRVRREVLKNNCFDRLRRRARRPASTPRWTAGCASRPATSASTASASTPTGEELLASCPTVIHSAATVSFDSPLDAAVEINLLGPVRMAAALNRLHAADGRFRISSPSPPPTWRAAAGDGLPRPPSRTPPGRPRWPGGRRSTPPAGPGPTPTPTAGIPSGWPASTARPVRSSARPAARSWPPNPNDSARTGSRTASSSAGKVAGPGPRLARRLRLHQVARRTGPARNPGRPAGHDRPAVDHRIGAGRARHRDGSAASGWPIPLIISYAKGLLKEFPGVPEGIIDVIPVDLVVAAILAVAARGPAPSPTSSTPPPGRATRCGTGSSSTWSGPGSSSIRSPTTRTSPSPYRSGRSPAVTGCSASSARRPRTGNGGESPPVAAVARPPGRPECPARRTAGRG